jgi:RNA polymerase sigma-70 factor (ECF subfamily)
MNSDSTATRDLVCRAGAGDAQALAELFARHRERLRQMVRLRLDRRLQGSLDPSEVLQQAYRDVAQQVGEYARNPPMPTFLWLRSLTGHKLVELQRQQLGARLPEAGEVSLYRGALPQASSVSLAAHLLGRMTSAHQQVQRAELQTRVQEVLNSMDPTDREVLTLRHFEMLNNDETAAVLNISTAAASHCYIRALKRLKDILASLQGFGGTSAP